MNKKVVFVWLAIVLLLAACAGEESPGVDAGAMVTATAVATTNPTAMPTAELMIVDEVGGTAVDTAVLNDTLQAIDPLPLSAAEIDTLLFMREEEKLAHDVYIALYDLWGLPVFQNIAASEQTHTDAVNTLLARYNLDDPAAGHEAGVFTNETLQELYTSLMTAGSQSLVDALYVGATIEDLDIVDLQNAIAEADNPDIILVYENLMQGSRNHLRAFVGVLTNQGAAPYVPQYLDQDSYNDIILSPVESGGHGQGNHGNRGNNGNGNGGGNGGNG